MSALVWFTLCFTKLKWCHASLEKVDTGNYDGGDVGEKPRKQQTPLIRLTP